MEEFNEDLSRELVIQCREGNLERVKEIIYSDDKIYIHYYYDQGHPLDWACYRGELEIVKFLINQDRYKINTELQDNIGYSPFMIASRCGRSEIVKFFLYQNKYNFDINIVNQYGETVLYLAKKYDHKEVIKVIDTYISFIKELQTLLFTFNNINNTILPNEMVDMIIKIRKRIERYYQIHKDI